MGMFDTIRCLYPLPWTHADSLEWQSKTTPAQYCDLYEIRADGTLWHQVYDLRVEETEESPIGFYTHRENVRWEQVKIDGEAIEIHHYAEHPARPGGWWYSVRFWFRDDVVKDLVCVKEDHGPNSGEG